MELFDRVFVLGSGSGFTTVGPREGKQMQHVCYKRWNVQLKQKLNCKCQLLRLVGRGGGMRRIQNQDSARDDEEREAFGAHRHLNSHWISIGSWKWVELWPITLTIRCDKQLVAAVQHQVLLRSEAWLTWRIIPGNPACCWATSGNPAGRRYHVMQRLLQQIFKEDKDIKLESFLSFF